MKKQFGILGLGVFGITLAKNLGDLGFDVIIVGEDEERIQVAEK